MDDPPERARLRRHGPDDRADFLALITDTAVSEHLCRHPMPETEAEREALWRVVQQTPEPGRPDLLAIGDRASTRYLGIAYLYPTAGLREAEFGLALIRPLWGRGLGVEIAGALVSRLWSCGAGTVIAHVASANERAVRMVRALGMQREASVDARFDRYAMSKAQARPTRGERGHRGDRFL